ncbi:B-cell receptor CD22 isoform X2 [Anarrhichthys ocellatus]|uniref:B-cell receptor CD22 isoform X2 n=1 Tax=Anarrhichthys ocellatus TaxID=433405 RepID=UPI0012EDE121|nr:B-cell receptor CD22-like isoform X2 [Anarrhichthys ocellatus]
MFVWISPVYNFPLDPCCSLSRQLMRAQIPKSHIYLQTLCFALMEKMLAMLVLLILKPETVSAGWSVTFEKTDPCALKGSSVELSCSYNYTDEETVKKTAWYKGELENGSWRRVALSDLPSYQNRFEYLGDQQHDCGLAIDDLQVNDTGHYYFRFDTEAYGRRSKESVYLTVTELSAKVYPDSVRAGDYVTLECITTCQLNGTVWFKDGLPVATSEFQARAEDAGNYFCAVKGQESVLSDPVALRVQYPPLNVSVEMSYSGHLTMGSSVNLTCSSAANPAADNYTWYSSAGSSFSSLLQVGSGQVLSLPSVEASHTGLYLCQASNRLGENNSNEVLLTVDETDTNRVILFVGIGVKVFIGLLLPIVIIWAWREIVIMKTSALLKWAKRTWLHRRKCMKPASA